MRLMEYFDLGIMPEELTWGKKDEEKEKKRRKRRNMRLLLTITMYLGVWLGIACQRIMALYQAQVPVNLSTFGATHLIAATIIATATFPQIFPKIFGRMPEDASIKDIGKPGWRVLQFCIAFEQGFFWQSIVSLLTPLGM